MTPLPLGHSHTSVYTIEMCMCIQIPVYKYLYINIYTQMHVFVFVWIYSCSGSSFCDNLSRHMRMTLWCVCECVCECVCTRLRMCVHMAVHVRVCVLLQRVAVCCRRRAPLPELCIPGRPTSSSVCCSALQCVAACHSVLQSPRALTRALHPRQGNVIIRRIKWAVFAVVVGAVFAPGKNSQKLALYDCTCCISVPS